MSENRDLIAEIERQNDRITGLTMELELAKVELARAADRAKQDRVWMDGADAAISRADEVIRAMAAQRDEACTDRELFASMLVRVYEIIAPRIARVPGKVVDAGPLEPGGQGGGETPSGEIQATDSGTTPNNGAPLVPCSPRCEPCNEFADSPAEALCTP